MCWRAGLLLHLCFSSSLSRCRGTLTGEQRRRHGGARPPAASRRTQHDARGPSGRNRRGCPWYGLLPSFLLCSCATGNPRCLCSRTPAARSLFPLRRQLSSVAGCGGCWPLHLGFCSGGGGAVSSPPRFSLGVHRLCHQVLIGMDGYGHFSYPICAWSSVFSLFLICSACGCCRFAKW